MSMQSRSRVFSSSVGSKVLIGLTGLGLVGYLVTHIAGNVLVFLGPTTFNEYSHTLLSNPLIPVIEVVLLGVFGLHVVRTVTMYLGNQAARPAKYAVKKPAGPPSRKTFSSTTMIFSGLWLLVFIVIHVMTFKYGPHYETASGVRDLYRLEMENFASPLSVAFYIVSLLVVGSHLWHGASSAFQSLGVSHPVWTPRLLGAGKAFAILIAGGFIVIALWAHLIGGRR